LTDQCKNGIFGTMAEAIEGITVPRVKETRPYCCYKGQLTLGDPMKYDTAMCIDIERYFRTHTAKPPSASSFVAQSGIENEESSAQSSLTIKAEDNIQMGGTLDDRDSLKPVKQARSYRVKDDSKPNGKREVDFEGLARGYEYGRTVVHIAASEENVTKLETVKGFSIIGFIPCSGVSFYYTTHLRPRANRDAA
jgi:ATP-dependent DNA helicase 2 subunit 2